MESNKNNDNNNGGGQHEHQQLRGSARRRTFNELANDIDQPADEDQPVECISKKNHEDGNDLDLEVCIYMELETKSFIESTKKTLVQFVVWVQPKTHNFTTSWTGPIENNNNRTHNLH
jgi:hypothetical protein